MPALRILPGIPMLLLVATFTAAAPTTPAVPPAAAPADWPERSRALADRLMGDLKAELAAALQAGGPIAAIEVCRERAPAIARDLSEASGARVGRTALRVRNPANAPDELEREVLEQFATQLARTREASESPLPEAVFEAGADAGSSHRYLRAIPMQAPCLACHGKTLAPEIERAIRAAYPDDAATGFEPGELRGAVVVRWPATP